MAPIIGQKSKSFAKQLAAYMSSRHGAAQRLKIFCVGIKLLQVSAPSMQNHCYTAINFSPFDHFGQPVGHPFLF
jgi:hypothetical protein